MKHGPWVEIEQTILTPEERAPQVPEDTRKTPYVLRVSGFLNGDLSVARVGDTVTVTTLIGRQLTGRLIQINPSYSHSFGNTVPELLEIGLPGTEENPQ